MTDAQKIQLERVRLGMGHQEASWLLENEGLWDAFVFGRFGYAEMVELRDLTKGIINADTLMILTDSRRVEALLKAASEIAPSEIGYCGCVNGKFVEHGDAPYHDGSSLGQALGGVDEGQIIIRLWWD